MGPDHADTLTSVNNLGALLLKARGKLDEAEALCRCSLERRERVLGPDHPTRCVGEQCGRTAPSPRQTDDAEPLFRRALEGRERVPGTDHVSTLTSVNNLGGLLEARGKLDEAEPLYRRALRQGKS